MYLKIGLLILAMTITSQTFAEGCMVTNSQGIEYWFPTSSCADFTLKEGEKCVDCCAFQMSGNMPAPPANTIPIEYELRTVGELTEVWDKNRNVRISTLTVDGINNFSGVYEVISTAFLLKENNGKGEIVTKDGSASFTLSPLGLEKLKKQNKKEVKAIEVKRKQK